MSSRNTKNRQQLLKQRKDIRKLVKQFKTIQPTITLPPFRPQMKRLNALMADALHSGQFFEVMRVREHTARQ